MKTSQGKMALKDIKMSLQDNWRSTGNIDVDYSVPTMVEDILSAGRIHTPLHVEKKTGELLRGFRRATAAKRIVDDQKSPKDVVKNLETVDVVFVEDMSPQERLVYRYDDGGFKNLSKSEIVSSYFKFRANMLEPAQIIPIMYLSLARYTGKTDKAIRVETLKGEERTKFLRTWFKGTVDQYFEYAYFCGPVVQEQLILTERAKERELTEEEKKRKLFDMDRNRCKELYDAKKAGQKQFDELIKKFSDIDSGVIPTVPESKRLTPSQIATQVSAANSQKYRKVILQSVLDDEDAVKARDQQGKIDAELGAIEALQEVCSASLDSVKKDNRLHSVMLAIAFPTPENVEKVKEALKVKEETAPANKGGKK
jgi:hypothetical protein